MFFWECEYDPVWSYQKHTAAQLQKCNKKIATSVQVGHFAWKGKSARSNAIAESYMYG